MTASVEARELPESLQQDVRLLRKPFTLDDLTAALAEQLHAVTGSFAPPVLDALWTAVACVDSDDTFVAANESYTALLGMSADAVIGRRLTEFATRAGNVAFFEGLDATRADGRQRRVRNHSLDFDRIYDNIFSRAGDYIVIEVADVTDEAREHDRRCRSRAPATSSGSAWSSTSSSSTWSTGRSLPAPRSGSGGRSSSSRQPCTTGHRDGAGQPPSLVGRVGRRVVALRRQGRAHHRRGVHHGRGAAPQERHPDSRRAVSATSTPSWSRGACTTRSAAS